MSQTASEAWTLGSDTVLVIGAGLAGLYLALKLAPRPAMVIAPRLPGGAASSAWAQGGMAAALGAGDSIEAHCADTLKAGAGLCDVDAVRTICEGGPAAVEALADLGAPFDRTAAGGYALGLEAAHSRPRVARVTGDQAGAAILRAVNEAAEACESVTISPGLIAIAMSRDETGRVAGALCRNADGRLVSLEAGETALALGGAGGLYAVTTNPPGAVGAALAMAAKVGAAIADAEFMQFHPTALDIGRDPAPLATEALRGEGARLRDGSGTYLLSDDLAPRDQVARAVHRAVQSGQGAFLDARDVAGEAFPQRFPTVFAACRKAELDPRRDLIPIAPAAHYHMGGVAADTEGRTSVDGLSAIGECASTGAHGANRLASNSLLEAVVVADRAAARLKNMTPAAPSAVITPQPPPRLSEAVRAQLRAGMSRWCGVERDADGLARLLGDIDGLIEQAGEANALLAARLIAQSALAREESRGAHYRTDFPESRDPAHRSRRSLDRPLLLGDGPLEQEREPAQ